MEIFRAELLWLCGGVGAESWNRMWLKLMGRWTALSDSMLQNKKKKRKKSPQNELGLVFWIRASAFCVL